MTTIESFGFVIERNEDLYEALERRFGRRVHCSFFNNPFGFLDSIVGVMSVVNSREHMGHVLGWRKTVLPADVHYIELIDPQGCVWYPLWFLDNPQTLLSATGFSQLPSGLWQMSHVKTDNALQPREGRLF